MRLHDLPGYLHMLQVRAGEAAIPAANAMGLDYEDELKRVLTRRSHAPGTRTPAPPGTPPARVSGALAGSVTTRRATTPVVATAVSGPRLPPRDYVQEYGGEMSARPGNLMHYIYDGPRYSEHVVVPARPYARPTALAMMADGRLAQAAADAFYKAMWG